MKLKVGKTYKVISGANGYDKGEVFTVTGKGGGVFYIQMNNGLKYSEMFDHMENVVVAEVKPDKTEKSE